MGNDELLEALQVAIAAKEKAEAELETLLAMLRALLESMAVKS